MSTSSHCNGISTSNCESISRIKAVLEKYQSIKHIENISPKQFKVSQILNDYNHIIIDHYQYENHRQQFEEIHQFISSNINCTPSNCSKIRRNYRIRQPQPQLPPLTDHDNDNPTCKESKEQHIETMIDDNNTLFIIDTIDSIHTHLIHSYDLGLKLKNNEMISLANHIQTCKQLKPSLDEFDEEYIIKQTRDNILPQIRNTLHTRRQGQRGLHRIHSTKFVTNLDMNTYSDSNQTDNDLENKNDVDLNEVSNPCDECNLDMTKSNNSSS